MVESPGNSPQEAALDRTRGRAAGRRKTRPQMSIAFMLLCMTILCAMSAAMFYAARVPAVSNEVAAWFGQEVEPQETKRTVHLAFLLFTYCSPLLLSALLGVVVSVLRWISPADPAALETGPSSPWDEPADAEPRPATGELR